MHREDLLKIIGATTEPTPDHLPVAMLLRSGHFCFGHYNPRVNEGLVDTIVVLSAELMEFTESPSRHRPWVEDFREFLVEIVASQESNGQEVPTRPESSKPIPLLAVPLSEIALVYPVAHIVELLHRAEQSHSVEEQSIPALFDLDKSEVLALLRMKLW